MKGEKDYWNLLQDKSGINSLSEEDCKLLLNILKNMTPEVLHIWLLNNQPTNYVEEQAREEHD